ncbi:hypothetical protein E2C01_099564 [Portunus trituberculatus]|uniref:Uncharacterized protein n=1 Tax=Portunus trituberculatus TaxID=210409 RepID=A0A5B7KAR4_PORTR|nr:hypothetical protein [Portunus trituberculatus]
MAAVEAHGTATPLTATLINSTFTSGTRRMRKKRRREGKGKEH